MILKGKKEAYPFSRGHNFMNEIQELHSAFYVCKLVTNAL